MVRISSRGTWLQKRVFPLIWFGGLAGFALFALAGERSGRWPIFAIMPIAMAAAGFFFMKKLIWPLMDEVYDADDYLVVIRRGDEERIALSDVINISAQPGRPPVVTLRLRNAGRFGTEIAFVPQSSFHFNPFAKNPIVEELITRVDRARSAARRA